MANLPRMPNLPEQRSHVIYPSARHQYEISFISHVLSCDLVGRLKTNAI